MHDSVFPSPERRLPISTSQTPLRAARVCVAQGTRPSVKSAAPHRAHRGICTVPEQCLEECGPETLLPRCRSICFPVLY